MYNQALTEVLSQKEKWPGSNASDKTAPVQSLPKLNQKAILPHEHNIVHFFFFFLEILEWAAICFV